jgi:hypothetical protein
MLPDGQLDVGPIVQPGAPEVAVFEGEPQRADQVQERPGPDAGAADVARVPVYVRGHKDDVAFG